MKPVIFSVVGVVFVTVLYWLGGFDFDKRGIVLGSWAMYSAIAASGIYAFAKTFE